MSSCTASVSACAAGATLLREIWMVTVAVSVPPRPSEIVYSKLSVSDCAPVSPSKAPLSS